MLIMCASGSEIPKGGRWRSRGKDNTMAHGMDTKRRKADLRYLLSYLVRKTRKITPPGTNFLGVRSKTSGAYTTQSKWRLWKYPHFGQMHRLSPLDYLDT